MGQRFVLVFFLLVLFSSAKAQYHLTEAGLSVGPGVCIPYGFEKAGPGPGINANAFFTHYVCGKRYGYQGMVGARYFNTIFNGEQDLSNFQVGKGDLFSFFYIDAGFFFKLRSKEFHKDNELALLVGPRLSVKGYSRKTILNDASALEDDAFSDLATALFGVRISGLSKTKVGKQFLYIEPGADIFFNPGMSNLKAGDMGQVFAFVNLGYTLWNSKTNKFTGK